MKNKINHRNEPVPLSEIMFCFQYCLDRRNNYVNQFCFAKWSIGAIILYIIL